MGSRVSALEVTAADDRLLSARVSAFLCEPHLHSTYTIGLMRAGVTRFRIRGRQYAAAPGDVFIVHPFEVHAGGDDIAGIEYDVLYPSSALMADAAGVRLEKMAFPAFTSVVLKASSLTKTLFDAVDAQLAHSGCQSVANTEQAIKEIFGPSRIARGSEELETAHVVAIKLACELIANFHEIPVDFRLLSDKVGMSRFHFIRVFHRATGLTPSAYLRQVRLSRVRDLIAGDGELADIAAEAGFSDQAHMTREFKHIYGITPGHLAKSLRNLRSRSVA